MMKKLGTLLLFLFTQMVSAQNVLIPDSIFKSVLVNNSAINTNGDTEIQLSEAVAFAGILEIGSAGINDLTGIEAFTQLSYLDCSFNMLTSLDLSVNTTLTKLYCSYNQLTSLYLPASASIVELYCDSNQLTSLDLSANTAITVLNCGHNQLTSLDLSANTAITVLNCGHNQLTSIDMSNNSAIAELHCGHNQLTSLDLSANNSITHLSCSRNLLTVLNVSTNIAITQLFCDHNHLTSLDLSSNTFLTQLFCDGNSLLNLDLSANTAITYISCAVNQISNLDLSANTALVYLNCFSNHLTDLNLSDNTLIDNLECAHNQLTSLDLSTNIAITKLFCSQNQLDSLDLNVNSALTTLVCSYNQITSLDLSTDTAITTLYCEHNQLTSLDLSFNRALSTFHCDNNNLSNLKIKNGHNIGLFNFRTTNNPNLSCIEVDSVNFMRNHFSNMVDTFTVFSSNCSGVEPIKGYIFKDTDSNCFYDSWDSPVANVLLKLYDSTNVLVQQIYNKASGFYQFNVPIGSYKVVLDTTGFYTFQCAQPGIDTTIITSFGDTINFDVICKSGIDLNVHSITNTNWVFPGQQHILNINAGDASQWNNLNCSSGIGGTVMITIGGPVAYVGPEAGALVPVVSGNTLTYYIPDFGTINNSTAFAVLLNTSTNAVIGDSVCISASITPSSGAEANTSNNTMHLCYAVRNSYDPNTKESYPITVLPGYNNYFTYKVNFQNTGTAQAFNIKVIDTLAANLDLNTFELLSYSHACEISIARNILTANFENINLADSTSNEAASHGYFQYRIKPLSNQLNGTHIKNTAHIFFDFNPAVATNTTINSFVLPNSINELQENEISIYPNPGNGMFTVSSKSVKDANLKISNVLGEVVYQMQLQKNKAALIDLSNQPKGVYVLRMEEEGKRFLNKKIVIQ
ncbi:MAG: leucine-rich repeat domain-containing protein [Bacteroidetes bacterium]|nr:leucine-rich repeat domain-containing protein [Bacteroidota bacterium]